MALADPVALLKRLCSEPREAEWLEFKMNSFDPEKVGRYISGLANSAMLQNEAHGYLVFGVENDTHNIVGTTVRLRSERVGNEPFENWVANRLDPKLAIEIASFEVDGKHIEMLVIEPAYQHPVRFSNTSWIRVGQQLRPLDEFPERARTIWMISSRYVFESGIADAHVTPAAIFDRFNVPGLLDLLGKPKLSNSAMLDYLLAEELVVDDRQGGFDVTNLLALLAARDLSKYPSVAGKAPRVISYEGTSKLEAVGDESGKLGYAITFRRLLSYIRDRTPFREVMEHGIRRSVYTYPEIAIRELLANALIHQDFTIAAGAPVIEIFSDRLQITNPGDPLVNINRFIDSPSRTRNAKLANLMRRAGLCEERGSGVDRALEAIERDHLPAPTFRLSDGSTIVTLLSERPFSKQTREDRVRACYQHACLKHEAGEAMSNGSLRIRFGMSPRQYPQVNEVINDAITAGWIRPLREEQANRTARYVPHWA